MDKSTLINMLHAFAAQRPGLNFSNYGDWQLYKREAWSIWRDLVIARELLGLVASNSGITADMIASRLDGSDRLRIDNDEITYIAGQYYPTEFRHAVSQLCVSLLWQSAAADMTPERKTRQVLQQRFKGRVSRTAARLINL